MEIRPEVMERLLSESDERLWETVRKLALMNNITLSLTPPPHADMEKLRAILRSGALDYEGAMRILANQRQGEKP